MNSKDTLHALQAAEAELADLTRRFGHRTLKVAEATAKVGVLALRSGQVQEGASRLRLAADALAARLGKTNPGFARRIREFAEEAERAGQPALAQDLRRRIMSERSGYAENNKLMDAAALQGFANSHQARGDLDDAEALFARALKLRRAEPESWQLASCLRIPTKPAMDSNRKPATCSDLKPASVPI
jgi:hypothetical protein